MQVGKKQLKAGKRGSLQPRRTPGLGKGDGRPAPLWEGRRVPKPLGAGDVAQGTPMGHTECGTSLTPMPPNPSGHPGHPQPLRRGDTRLRARGSVGGRSLEEVKVGRAGREASERGVLMTFH